MKQLASLLIEYLLIPLVLAIYIYFEEYLSKDKKINPLSLKIYNSGVEYILVCLSSCISIIIRGWGGGLESLDLVIFIFIIICIKIFFISVINKKRNGANKENYIVLGLFLSHVSLYLLTISVYLFWLLEPGHTRNLDYYYSAANIAIFTLVFILGWYFVIYKRVFTDLLANGVMRKIEELKLHQEHYPIVVGSYKKLIYFSTKSNIRNESRFGLVEFYLNSNHLSLNYRGLAKAIKVLRKLKVEQFNSVKYQLFCKLVMANLIRLKQRGISVEKWRRKLERIDESFRSF